MTVSSPVPLLPDASALASLWALPLGLAGLALLRRKLLRGPGRELAEPARPAWRRALGGAAAALALLAATVLPAVAAGAFLRDAPGWAAFAPPPAEASLAAAPSSLAFFAVQSLAEELLFRAALLTFFAFLVLVFVRLLRGPLPSREDPAARQSFGRLWLAAGLVANAVQAVGFAFLHAGNPHATPLALFNIGLAGAVLGWLFWSGAGLAGPWTFHAIWNFGLAALGLPVSGLALGTPAVEAGLKGAGRPLLSGGAFGPEGSLVATLALLALLAGLVARSARRLPTG